MSDRSTQLYESVFDHFKEIGIEPQSLMSDFERAIRKSACAVWPDIEINGCWFHYCQAIRKRLLLETDNDSTNEIVRMFLTCRCCQKAIFNKLFQL